MGRDSWGMHRGCSWQEKLGLVGARGCLCTPWPVPVRCGSTRIRLGAPGSLGEHQHPFGSTRNPFGKHQHPFGSTRIPLGITNIPLGAAAHLDLDRTQDIKRHLLCPPLSPGFVGFCWICYFGDGCDPVSYLGVSLRSD